MTTTGHTAVAEDKMVRLYRAALIALDSAEMAMAEASPFTIARSYAMDALRAAQKSVAEASDAYRQARAQHDERAAYQLRFETVA